MEQHERDVPLTSGPLLFSILCPEYCQKREHDKDCDENAECPAKQS